MEVSKTRNAIGWILSIIPAAVVTFSAMMQIVGNQQIKETMADSAFADFLPLIGLTELTCLALYFIPKTSNIGFFLLCSLFGGIIATEAALGQSPITGIVLLTMLFIGTMLRKPELSGLNI